MFYYIKFAHMMPHVMFDVLYTMSYSLMCLKVEPVQVQTLKCFLCFYTALILQKKGEGQKRRSR